MNIELLLIYYIINYIRVTLTLNQLLSRRITEEIESFAYRTLEGCIKNLERTFIYCEFCAFLVVVVEFILVLSSLANFPEVSLNG